MAMPLRVRLNEEERVTVEERYTMARDAETRTRYQMVLLAADGKSAPSGLGTEYPWTVLRAELRCNRRRRKGLAEHARTLSTGRSLIAM